jgi:hypothetical protein
MTTESTKRSLSIRDLDTPARTDADTIREQAERAGMSRIDGRSLRRTGRTETLSFKVKPETVSLVQKIAAVEQITMVEALERALEHYDRMMKGQK